MSWNDATAWIPVARNIRRYLCCNPKTDEVLCRHRSAFACISHRPGAAAKAELKNGEIVSIELRRLSASNGERAVLPYAATEAAYEAVLRCDRGDK
jgi:hypothetical protein